MGQTALYPLLAVIEAQGFCPHCAFSLTEGCSHLGCWVPHLLARDCQLEFTPVTAAQHRALQVFWVNRPCKSKEDCTDCIYWSKGRAVLTRTTRGTVYPLQVSRIDHVGTVLLVASDSLIY